MPDSGESSSTEVMSSESQVEWERPEDAQFYWVWDQLHYPAPITPLTSTFQAGAFTTGSFQALEQLGMPIRRRFLTHNGYWYVAIVPASSDPDEMARIRSQSDARLEAAVLSLERDWYERYRPELEADVAAFQSFDYAGATTEALADHVDWVIARKTRQMMLHFLTTTPQIHAMSLFTEEYKRIFGVDDELEAQVLLQGLPNRTVDGGHALWRLSRLAARSQAVGDAVLQLEPEAVFARLETTLEGREFAEAFRAYLEEFGWRGDSVGMDDPAWIDYPKRPLITLRGYMAQPDDASPEMVQADLAAKREAAIAAARGKLASAPAEDRTRFETLLHAAQIANVLHEDHNYLIDQMLQNRSRHAFIEAGKRLAAQGRIAAAEDVLYLSIFELQSGIRSGSAGGLHDLVDERRRRHEYQRTIVPPRTLGTPPAQVEPQTNYQKTRARFYGAAIEPSVEVHQIRGNAGSRGKVTGMARVALSLEQAANLQHGEILVCTTTAPAWTPLFATAAAVVTDTGGILSHCAAVAREFGIPAVVGTNVATSRIKSGQRVTVDGSRGIVTIEVV